MIPPALSTFYNKHRDARLDVLYRPDLTTAEAICTQSGLPYLPIKLPFALPHAEMLREAQALKMCFVPHRTSESHRGWRSLCIHGQSSVHTSEYQRYGHSPETVVHQWTDVARFCPVTTSVYRDLFGYRVYERLRFMLLEPGGYVLPHTDAKERRLFACNVALNNPAGCEFVMADVGVVPFHPGTVNLLSLERQHIVWNRSTQVRIHMIINGQRDLVDGHWRETIPNSYRAMFGR
jgi:hypothetical protein